MNEINEFSNSSISFKMKCLQLCAGMLFVSFRHRQLITVNIREKDLRANS